MIFDTVGVEEILGYEFKDKLLLRKCFTHSSYANEHGEKDNELLEFFGDSIIQLVVTEYLYKNAKGDEGKLTEKRKDMVSKQPLLDSVKKLGLDNFLLLGEGQRKTHGGEEKLYSSVYEAVVAGIYLDGGIAPAKKFIKKTIIADFEQKSKLKANTQKAGNHAKAELQEYIAKRKLGSITYDLLGREGPDHEPKFRIAVLLNGRVMAEGLGTRKSLAESSAAEKALEKIKKQEGKK